MVESKFGKQMAERLESDGDDLIHVVQGGFITNLMGPRDHEGAWSMLAEYMTADGYTKLKGYVDDTDDHREYSLVFAAGPDGSIGVVDGVEYEFDTDPNRPKVIVDHISGTALGVHKSGAAYYVRDIELSAFVPGGKLVTERRVALFLLPGDDGSWVIDDWDVKTLTDPKFVPRD